MIRLEMGKEARSSRRPLAPAQPAARGQIRHVVARASASGPPLLVQRYRPSISSKHNGQAEDVVYQADFERLGSTLQS